MIWYKIHHIRGCDLKNSDLKNRSNRGFTIRKPLILVIVPPWPNGGSTNLFLSSMSVIAKRGYDLYVLVAATTATNGHAVNNLDKTVTKLSPHASLGCGHTGQSHGRGPVQSKPELELLSIYIANGTLPDTLESVLEECSIAAIYVHHCWNLKLAHKIQHRVSSAFGNQPAIFCESHDIQSRGSYILNGRQSQAEKTISLEESEAAEIDLCKLADCMVHINRDDFRFFHDRLPQGRHALLPPTIAPESETALRALRDEVDPAASKLIYVAAPNYWNAVTTCWLLEKVMPRVDGMRENFLIFGELRIVSRKSAQTFTTLFPRILLVTWHRSKTST